MKMFYFKLILMLVSCASLSAQEVINNLEELKAIQGKVRSVSAKSLDVTVCIRSSIGAFGSGVVVSKEGLILTAAHVIHGVEEVEIIFSDGKTAQAKVLGANYSKDIAMCKILKPSGLNYAEIASSEKLRIGQFVVAMGHAYGYDSVRTPPVRFGRVLSKQTNYFITTDCTLIGGDSGGPLFDLEGRVVAIHSNIGDTWSTNNHGGVSGFVKDWERLKKGERWGVLSINPMTNPESPAIGVILGQAVRGGVYLEGVVKNGPAHKAGLLPGDVITKINQQSIQNANDLIKEVLRYNSEDDISIDFYREGKKFQKNLTLGKREIFQGLSR